MPPFNNIVLLGAGFSRNWGGWLASEVYEFLLGAPDVDEPLRQLLLSHRAKGFEHTLDYLQTEEARTGQPDPRLGKLLNAIGDMFREMNRGLMNANFSLGSSGDLSINEFLIGFDAIFTLNQDVLLEAHYLNDNIGLLGNRRWNGWTIPGMKMRNRAPTLDGRPAAGEWEPDGNAPAIHARMQPYVKLHGSSNWRTSQGRLMVVGGRKVQAIKRSPPLDWNFDTFENYLARPLTRLMVIGYSFHDDHVNDAIVKAAARPDFEIFIVDTLGLDVLDPPSRGAITPPPSALAQALLPRVRGSSRRHLTSTFSSDEVERRKLLRFVA
jgi:hypothetical protein